MSELTIVFLLGCLGGFIIGFSICEIFWCLEKALSSDKKQK